VSRVVAALVVLVAAVAWRGGFAGWAAAEHARRANAIVLTKATPPSEVERALAERSRALDLEPLSRRYRIALDAAVDEALPILGVTRVISVAPAPMLPRTVFAEVLRRYGEETAASQLLGGIGVTRPEELAVIDDAMLKRAALAAALADPCTPALPLLDAAAARFPEDYDVTEGYAGCLIRTGHVMKALPALLRAQERNPQSKWVRFYVAQLHFARGNLPAAAVATFWLARDVPDFYHVWRLRGEVMAAAGQTRAAVYCYRKALQIRPEQKTLWYRINQLKAAALRSPPAKDNSQGGR
jgi:predicted Zn-dependent protease